MKCRLVGEQHGDQDLDQQHGHVRKRVRRQAAQHERRSKRNGGQPLERLPAGRSGASGAGHAAHRGVRLAEQAPRPHHQHDRHHDEFRDQREAAQREPDAEDRHMADADAQRLDLAR